MPVNPGGAVVAGDETLRQTIVNSSNKIVFIILKAFRNIGLMALLHYSEI
jgi:hypothetical protein